MGLNTSDYLFYCIFFSFFSLLLSPPSLFSLFLSKSLPLLSLFPTSISFSLPLPFSLLPQSLSLSFPPPLLQCLSWRLTPSCSTLLSCSSLVLLLKCLSSWSCIFHNTQWHSDSPILWVWPVFSLWELFRSSLYPWKSWWSISSLTLSGSMNFYQKTWKHVSLRFGICSLVLIISSFPFLFINFLELLFIMYWTSRLFSNFHIFSTFYIFILSFFISKTKHFILFITLKISIASFLFSDVAFLI